MNTILKKRAEYKADAVKELQSILHIPKISAEVLAVRGIDTANKAKMFLNPSSESFYDPFLLSGMKECVDRIREAVLSRERVVVFGDYDADGVCSTAMFSMFLQDLGLEVVPYIPSRHNEGYGISAMAVENIIEDIIPDLIITCDCGISAKNEIETILDCGISVIVTDHHEPPDELPDCVLVNPKLKAQEYPFNSLCGAGVVFKVIQAYSGLSEAMKYLDLACIASIADLVPLTDENRAIVALGLKLINSDKANIGIRSMIRLLGLGSRLTSTDIAFKLSPRINAAGRMGDAYRALNLFLAESELEAEEVFNELNAENDRRKSLCLEVYNQAVELLKQTDYANNVPIILSHRDWEKGLTSIVAAQIAGEFNRPAFLLVQDGEYFKGTARSIEGIHVYDALKSVSDLLTEFGGHDMAAGFCLHESKLNDFRNGLNAYFSEKFSYDNFVPRSSYDLEIEPKDITLKVAKDLELLEPYGAGFPRPVFLLKCRGITAEQMKNKTAHLNLKFPDFNICAFNYGGFLNLFDTDSEFRLAVELGVNNYNSREYINVQMRCLDFDFIGGVKNEDKLSLYFFNTLSSLLYSESKPKALDAEAFKSIISSKHRFGTLIAVYSFNTYSEILRRFPVLCEFCHSYINRENSVNFNRVVLSPAPDFDTSGYGRIIHVGAPLFPDRPSFKLSNNAECFLLEGYASPNLPAVKATREAFIECYKLFNGAVNSVYGAKDIVSFVCGMTNDLSLMAQLIACYNVFYELGILSFDPRFGTLNINAENKRDLAESRIYKYLTERFK